MRHLLLVVAAFVLLSPAAYAQEQGQVGLTFGTPSGLGIIYHVNDQVAIRPELSVASTSGLVDVTTWTIGVSGLFYLQHWDALRTYVAPRFAYGHSSTSSDSSGSSSNYQFAGSFGAQYALHRRFSVFGEAGFNVSHVGSSTSLLSGASLSSTGVSTRSSVGAIFYFD